MFNKTKWKLISLNAAVFFVLFAALGLGAYGFVRHETLSSADEALRSRAAFRVVPVPLGAAAPLRVDPGPAPGGAKRGNAGEAGAPVLTFDRVDATVWVDAVKPGILDETGGNTGGSVGGYAGESVGGSADGPAVSLDAPEAGMLFSVRLAQTDRTVYTIFWDERGQPVSGLLSEELDEAVLQRLKDTLHQTSPYTVASGGRHFRVIAVDGDEGATAVRAAAAGSYIGVPVARVQYITNITEEMDMLRRLLLLLAAGLFAAGALAVLAGWYLARRALVPIRAAWDRQQQFVADASHELRTPLTVMQSCTELLLRHPDRTIEEESRTVTAMLRESRRMRKLVDGLLTLARTDSNQLELCRKPLRADELVARTVELVGELAACKGIEVRTDIAGPAECVADEERLHQLLLIVLDNAVKYTPPAGSITARCAKRANTVHIAVEDTGVGISEADLPHVFERFYRGDKSRSREEGGLGLGLSIARWIVGRHGGRIRVESRPGAGTTVHIALPAQA